MKGERIALVLPICSQKEARFQFLKLC